MEKWVLSIVGTVALGVLVDIILPEGSMAKYIKGVFAIVVVTVVIAPLPNFFLSLKNGHIIPPNYGGDMEIDSSFVQYVDDKKISSMEAKIDKILMNYGLNHSKVVINDNKKDDIIDSIRIEVDSISSIERVYSIVESLCIKFGEVKVVARGT